MCIHSPALPPSIQSRFTGSGGIMNNPAPLRLNPGIPVPFETGGSACILEIASSSIE